MGIVFASSEMVYLSVPLAAVILVLIPTSLFIFSKYITSQNRNHISFKQQNAIASDDGHVQESYSGFSEIKLYGKDKIN